MKYFIVAGEQSGDLHGSNLVRGLLRADPGAEIVCWGGSQMEAAGARVLMNYRNLAIMGFVNVVVNIPTVIRNLSLCRRHIKEYNPDVVILIDFPGFNFKIAAFAKSIGLKVFYYISPKLWAWNESRVEKVRKYVDRMFIIFPFEEEFYNKHGIGVKYYGNPLVDEIEKRTVSFPSREEVRQLMGLDERPVICMLAGSRKHEVEHILPEMVKTVKHFKGYQFLVAGAGNIPESIYGKFTGGIPIKIVIDKTYEALWISEAALVKSGTSTLEAALLGIPQVVCYRGDSLSFAIARRLVKVRFISLVNLIMQREVVKELIQHLLTEENLVAELSCILKGGDKREKILNGYSELRKILGPSGASDRTADEMVKLLKAY